jgi:carboxypeptidase PM20D1
MRTINTIKQSNTVIKTLALGLICLLPLMVPRSGASQANDDQVAENLSRAIQFKTISHYDSTQDDPEEFLGFIQFLEETYPLIHETLTKEVVSDYSLLYTWQGSDPDAKPIVLMSHIDVVPIEPGTEGDWTYPPFEGRIADGFIWGRGTQDTKHSLMGIMEAIEILLDQGYKPGSTIYLAFGQDEEVLGTKGAVEIAALLKSRGVEAEYVLDEGGTMISNLVPGLEKPASLIGIAEKGFLSLELTVEGEGGHSSRPPRHSAIGILCSAIHRLEKRQFPAEFGGATKQMFEFLAPEMEPPYNFIFGNTFLLGGLIELLLAQSPETNATVRTVFSTTVFQAGTKDNILPQNARAVVNFRILPGETIQGVIDHVVKVINDPKVEVKIIGTPSEPSSITDVEFKGFKVLEETINQLFPETVVAPYLCIAASDSRHYDEISDTILRFVPNRWFPEDMDRVHGTDERIAVDNYNELITFYRELIRNSD